MPVIVEDRPGAGGNIAAAIVARAEPDGHMLLVTGSNQAANPTLLPNPGFDYERDLVPVSMLVASKLLLVASPSFPAKNITDVIGLARAKAEIGQHRDLGDRHAQSSCGVEMLAQFGDIDLTFVPYDSVAQAIPDLIAGRVDLTVAALSSLLPQVQNRSAQGFGALLRRNALRLLPKYRPRRKPECPELQIDGWIGVLTTGGTPAPDRCAPGPGDRQSSSAAGSARCLRPAAASKPSHLNPNQLGVFLQAEAARFGGLLKHSRIRRASP